ncbi:MAG TPA: ATP-binding protein, partial [Pyrinomonadaceae bacterium]|nr:ATP-binding protein [Pyrinomonadaceae bacterium]
MDDLTQREFLAELEELIEQLFALTEDLRRLETSGPIQRELTAKIFRCLHSIKGVASAAGLFAIAELANQTETVLDGARAGRIEIATAFVDTLEDVANAISEGLSDVTAGTPERSSELLIQRLKALGAGAVRPITNIRLTDLPAEIVNSLNEREKRVVLDALRENTKLYLIDVNFDVAVFDTEFQQLRETLARYGEVICTLPSAVGPAANLIGFRLFYTSEAESFELHTHLAAFPAAIVTEFSLPSPIDQEVAEPQREPSSVRASAGSSPSSFIRLELDELDHLCVSAHEVFDQIVAALVLVASGLSGDARTELRNLGAQVQQSLTDLEEQIIELRTIPVGRVIQRAIRAGQVAARSAGKKIEFSVAGSDLRIDKVICDTISTPLLHLIRNAVDHGIETPAQRTNAGKRPVGIVHIEASAAGGEVSFVVSDDGRGIDPQVISLAAATRGLIEKDTVLDMDQSLQLIFRHGFSTAATVSNLSGRGVGLDVVGISVAQVGGSV